MLIWGKVYKPIMSFWNASSLSDGDQRRRMQGCGRRVERLALILSELP